MADPQKEPLAISERLGEHLGEHRELLLAFKWPLIGAGLTLLLILVWFLWPSLSVDDLKIVDHDDPAVAPELILDTNSAASLGSATLIAAERVVVRGSVRLKNDRVLVANEIVFEPGGRISVPSGHLTILAPRITGAIIDVSGRDGLDGLKAGAAGADGEAGGNVLVAGAAITTSQILAKGGAGGNGARGYIGAPGRNGICGPRGFGLAERGAPGGTGGTAGSGGDGGIITLLYQVTPVKGDAADGPAGTPGRGGGGGRGGAGCTGLRGNQPNQPPGNEGAPGRNGSRGAMGHIETRHVAFGAVIDAFNEWLDKSANTPDLLRTQLLVLRQLDQP